MTVIIGQSAHVTSKSCKKKKKNSPPFDLRKGFVTSTHDVKHETNLPGLKRGKLGRIKSKDHEVEKLLYVVIIVTKTFTITTTPEPSGLHESSASRKTTAWPQLHLRQWLEPNNKRRQQNYSDLSDLYVKKRRPLTDCSFHNIHMITKVFGCFYNGALSNRSQRERKKPDLNKDKRLGSIFWLNIRQFPTYCRRWTRNSYADVYTVWKYGGTHIQHIWIQ